MNELIIALENNNSTEALKILVENPNLLLEKSEDGWDILQLASYYNQPNIITYFLTNASVEAINNIKTHAILIAFEEKNEAALQAFFDFPQPDKINWKVTEKNGDNLLYLAIHTGLEQFIDPLIQRGVSCFENNSQDLNAFSLIVEKGNVELFDKFNQKNELSNNYNELLIKKSIQKDYVEIFERLYSYTKLTPDQLMELAAGFNSVKVMNAILQSGDIIPGMKQITKIVDLMCQKYEDPAAIKAATNMADYLFEINTPFNSFVNELGQSAWMLCIQNNNEEVFDRLMSSNENVNVEDSEKHSPLFYAIEKNNLKFVQLLLRKKASPSQTDKNNSTPLIKAVEKGNIEIIKELLKYYQLVNHTNSDNEHALSLAIKKKRMDIVTELIWAGGEITTNPVKLIEEKDIFFFGTDGQAERKSYADEENIDNFVALARLGFKLDQKNSEGDTFLLHFIKNGYMANFSAILRCPMNPNQYDAEGNSALMCAIMKKQDVYFNSLLKRFNNIDYTAKNKEGKNVYDLCLKINKVDRMQALVTADTNISKENAIKAAKIIAKDGNLPEYAAALIKAGVDMNLEDENKNNLVMFALAGGNLENFRFLVEDIGIKIDPEHRNKNGNSIDDIVNAMPDEIASSFRHYISKSLKKKP